MSPTCERVSVIGASGPTGSHLVRELARRGRQVVAVSRSRDRMAELFGAENVEIRVADALVPAATARAIESCDLVVDCIGLPPERMADHPRTAKVIADAARREGARCLQISSYWSFFPQRRDVVDESHPRLGGHEWFRLRREAEDVMLAAGAAVVHLPDFFGPEVHTSAVQAAFEEAIRGGSVSWPGPDDLQREVVYVPDAMRIVADLSEREEAYGTDWGVPGNGVLSGLRFAAISSSVLGREVTVHGAPGWLVRILGLVHPRLRRIRPIVPEYLKAVRYDTSKLRGLLGTPDLTPLDEAIERTFAWLRRRQVGGGLALDSLPTDL